VRLHGECPDQQPAAGDAAQGYDCLLVRAVHHLLTRGVSVDIDGNVGDVLVRELHTMITPRPSVSRPFRKATHIIDVS